MISFPENKSNPKTILFVDDDPVVSKITPLMLGKLGYRVICAVNGYQAVKTYNEKTDIIDLVILDYMMPGLSGEQTFKELKKLDDQVKVILSSGYITEKCANELIDSGCLGFLPKPFTMDKLSSMLSELIP